MLPRFSGQQKIKPSAARIMSGVASAASTSNAAALAPSAADRAMASLAPVRLCQMISRQGSASGAFMAHGWPLRLSIVNRAHLSAALELR